MAKNLILISIIIPCFNEEKRLEARFNKALPELKKIKGLEIIFVNDGSTDKTLYLINKLSKKLPQVEVISYEQNRGKGFAVKQGVKKARGEIIGYIDADFSYSLDNFKVINEINSGTDIVIADRSLRRSSNNRKPSLIRNFLGRFLAFVNNFFLELSDIKDSQCGFKFFKRNVAKKLFEKITLERWLFDIEILKVALEKGYKIKKLNVNWEDVRGSKVNIFKDLIPVGKDLGIIYLKFFSIRILILATIILLSIFLGPYFFNPDVLIKRSGDFSDFVWPTYYFVKYSFDTYGQIPLWNPTLFSGIPEIANPASPIIYPPNYLLFILPIGLTIILVASLHVVLGAVFAFLIGRQMLKFDRISSLVLAIAISFSPFLWSKLSVGHVSNFNAMLLLPPIVYFGLRFFRKQNLLTLFLSSIFLSLQYLNHPTHWYYTVLFGGLVLMFNSIALKNWKSLLLFLAAPFSLLLIFPIFIIQLQAGSLITRSKLGIDELAIPIWSISRFVKSVLLPSNLTGELETEVWLYPSILLTILGAFGLIRLKMLNKLLLGFVLLLVIIVTLGGRTPVHGILTEYLPGFSLLRVVTRDWFIFTFVISILAASFINDVKGKLKKTLAILVILDLVVFSAMRLWFVPGVMQPNDGREIKAMLWNDGEGGRYYCTSRCISGSLTVPEHTNTADGYHVLILKNYREALSDAGGFKPPKYTGNIPNYEDSEAQPSAKKLGDFAVKWVITKSSLEDQDFLPTLKWGDYMLYSNRWFTPRVRMKSSKNGQAEIIFDSPNEVRIKTSGDGGLLVLADSYYPGWEGYVNGRKSEVIEYNKWQRALWVPDGDNIVLFKFNPLSHLY